jgi:hypothetical protein
MAPELYDDQDYTEKVDVYSFALLLYEIVVGRLVFARSLSQLQLCRKLAAGERAEIPPIVRTFLKSLIPRAWATDPRERPSFAEIDTELQKNKFGVEREGFNEREFVTYWRWLRAAESG